MINVPVELMAVIAGVLGTGVLMLRGNIWKKKAKKSKENAKAAKAQVHAHVNSQKEEKVTRVKIEKRKVRINASKNIGDIIQSHIDRVREANAKRDNSDS